jgi:hypothetical protein
VVLGIIAGGLVLAAARSNGAVSTLVLVGAACLVTLVLACAAWLLLTGSTQQTEQRLFAIAALLLVGGAADYLSLSALLGGLLAGAFWQTAGGDARESVLRDALYIQRPLAILMLVVAGARAEPTLAAAGLALLVFLLRLLVSPMGRMLSRRAPEPESESALPDGLPFDVFGVAFALNALRAVGPAMTIVLSVVVLATITTEVWGWLRRRGAPA